jgi:hypothetical protein
LRVPDKHHYACGVAICAHSWKYGYVRSLHEQHGSALQPFQKHFDNRFAYCSCLNNALHDYYAPVLGCAQQFRYENLAKCHFDAVHVCIWYGYGLSQNVARVSFSREAYLRSMRTVIEEKILSLKLHSHQMKHVFQTFFSGQAAYRAG